MSFTPSIQWFPGVGSFLGSGANAAIIRWSSNRLHFSDSTAAVYFTYELSTGQQIAQASKGASIGPPFAADNIGNFYVQKGGSNYNGQDQIDGETLEVTGFWGTASSGVGPPTATGSPIGGMACCSVGNAQWLIIAAFSFAANLEICSVLGNAPQFGGTEVAIAESAAVCSPGPSSDAMGTVFVVGRQGVGGPDQVTVYRVDVGPGASGWQLSDWPTQNGAIAVNAIRTLAPADVDPTWSTITVSPSLIYDQTDGNIMLFVGTTDAVANKFYILKLDATAGTTIWSRAVPEFQGGTQIGLSRIKYGQYCWIVNTGNLCTLDTRSGDLTEVSTGYGGIQAGQQSFDDSTGIIFGNFDFTSGIDVVPRNSTPASYSGQWSALYAVPGLGPFGPAPYSAISYTRVWGPRGGV